MRKIVSGVVLGIACVLASGCGCTKRHNHVALQEAVPAAESDTLVAVAVERVPVSETLHFKFDSDQLTAKDQQALDQLALVIANNSNATIKVDGFADVRGTSLYNRDLGMRRAKAVVAYLADKGIDTHQFVIESYGSEKVIDVAQNESAHARNRRVELSFEAESQVS